jgi:DNA modification methylase
MRAKSSRRSPTLPNETKQSPKLDLSPDWRRLKVEYISPHSLKPYPRNARTHNRKQRRALEASIKRFGFTNPALVTSDNEIIAGHGRVEAAKAAGLATVPIIRIDHLNETERRAYILADNKLALQAGWDREMLAIELQHLIEVGFDIEIAGFEAPEIDLILDAASETERDPGLEDVVPALGVDRETVTRSGDVWLLGSKKGSHHRLLCSDSRNDEAIAALMGRDLAAMMITDPPYNVRVQGHVSGKGRTRHPEFAMASGEMKEEEFVVFLRSFLSAALKRTAAGALLYVFMDWRHLFELMTAARLSGLTMVNLCVWNKNNGGMGSLYRSKHELVLIFRSGHAPYRNNVELGANGRSRANVWDYAGVNTFRSGRDSDLKMHPTLKPCAMISDAIRDVTKRGEIILDPFGGSGTTIIASEATGRLARVIEIDRHYCDVAVCRWQNYTGKQAVLAETGETFEEATERRQIKRLPGPSRHSVSAKKEKGRM